MKTLDQKRANDAWSAFEEAGRLANPSDRKEFGKQAKRLPMRILSSGLGQALAFLAAKGAGRAYTNLLLKRLSSWIVDERQIGQGATLIEAIRNGDADVLMRATDEALAWLQWLVRFSEAEGWIEGDAD